MKRKKIFTIILTTVFALSANAQDMIRFSPFLSENNPCKWEADGITLTATDNKGKMTADASVRRFHDGQRFTGRLKTGGKWDAEDNTLTVTVSQPGMLTIYASSGSSNEARALTLLQGGKTISTATLDNRNKTPITTAVDAGDVTISYYDGGMSIYAIKFEAEK